MRIFTSPVSRFPGEISIPEALTFSQFAAWRNAIDAASEKSNQAPNDIAACDKEIVAGALAVVAEWRIENIPSPLTVDNFPATPRKSSNALVAWLVRCISLVISEEEEIPKA